MNKVERQRSLASSYIKFVQGVVQKALEHGNSPYLHPTPAKRDAAVGESFLADGKFLAV
jgi:hypothetical protein